ncbi:MAG: transposase [Saprospiraceae bacterium]|nr:transposase [Saprospiraceae bacterium]
MFNKPEYTRFLPHYQPKGSIFFVTFRLQGSLPRTFFDRLSDWYQTEKEGILLEANAALREQALYLLQRDYFRKLDASLDQCLCGATHLANPIIAGKITEQLRRFDHQWYRLLAYTIMPNHVHVLLDFSIQSDKTAYVSLSEVMNRIKGASARNAHLALGKTGAFWQPEYHDRYIRNQRHLLAAVDYIKQNVVTANICAHWREHPFTWIHEDFW